MIVKVPPWTSSGLSFLPRARSKKLQPDEIKGGTFTITNPGVFGSLFGTPIINQPQVAILGIGGIKQRPVVVHDAIGIRWMVYLALSYDHRVVDGAVAEQLLLDHVAVLRGPPGERRDVSDLVARLW